MPSTHLSLHYHLVFSTKGRAPVIADAWRERLHAYLGGVVRNIEGVPEAIGGIPRALTPHHRRPPGETLARPISAIPSRPERSRQLIASPAPHFSQSPDCFPNPGL